jgi:hypothetical protein
VAHQRAAGGCVVKAFWGQRFGSRTPRAASILKVKALILKDSRLITFLVKTPVVIKEQTYTVKEKLIKG